MNESCYSHDFPPVSVITVCLNAREALDYTLANISRQDYPKTEVIIVDGASSDGTRDVIARYKDIITKSVSEPDRGIYDAMNKGVAMASGEYCIFMNAGDAFASPDVLSRAMTGDKADVIYGDVVKNDRHGNSFIKKAEPPHNSHRMFFCHQSSLTRTSCLREHPFDIRYNMSADFKLFKMLLKDGRTFRQLDFPVSIFDTTGVSNTDRAAGLHQNINIIKEVDNPADKVRLLPRLYFVTGILRIRKILRKQGRTGK